MKVMGYYVKFCSQEPLQVPYGFLQVLKGWRVSDISDVRRCYCKAVFIDCRVCIQFRPDSENTIAPQIDGCPFRGYSPREADDIPVAHHGIVTAVDDLPVM